MKKLLSFTAVYGITHLLVDAICVGTVLSLQVMNQLDNKTSGCFIVLYNLIAFGIQPILGYLCDHYQRSKNFAVLGVLLTICPLLLLQSPWIVVIMLGIGNALYHIGGGIMSLNTTPNKATAPGLFVAPGAIGVFVATIIAGNMTALIAIAAPLLTWGMDNWVLGLLGLLFFNLTMPITLTVLANTFKKYKGFAFGLTTSALVAGYLINRFWGVYYNQNPAFVVGGVLASAGLLYFSLEKWTDERKIIRTERYD